MVEASYIKQKKFQELAAEDLKIRMEIERAKAKIMEGDEQKFREIVKQEDLGNKLSEKFQFPQKVLNRFCENSSKPLDASTTKSNQRYSKPVTMKVMLKIKKVLGT